MNTQTKKLTLSGFFLALALLLPFVTMQIPQLGSALLPMHLPVLLCGFVCGGPAGALVGFASPLLRNLLFGMPPLFPTGIAMAAELCCYGFLAGFVYDKLKKTSTSILPSLLIAMLGGRAVWGIVSVALYRAAGTPFGWQLFFAGAFLNALPGILVQLILIPLLVLALKKTKLSL
ncbi:MAG: ECF transporter S component [Pygmaiobacter sp.]